MLTNAVKKFTSACVLAAGVALLAGTTPASATTYTRSFTGEGFSDKGLSFIYARLEALEQARADGFVDSQCQETARGGYYYHAWVTMTCSREV